MDGYAVDTAELRNFRDNSLVPLTGDLSRLQQALMDAGVPSGAYPPIVADVARTHAANHASTLQGLGVLKGTVDGDGDKLTKTAFGYDAAEFGSGQAVASMYGDPVNGGVQPVSPTTGRTSTVPAAAYDGAGAATTSVSTTQVHDAYNVVEKLLASLGLSGFAHQLKKSIDAIVRPSEPFREAAGKLDGVQSTVGDLRTAFFSDLGRLKNGQWLGPASDQHLDATTARYQPHFDAIETYSKVEAQKHRYNAQAQDKQNFDVFYVLSGLGATLMTVTLIRWISPASTVSSTLIAWWAVGTTLAWFVFAMKTYRLRWKK
jgi:hypothetical protein